MIRGDRGQSTVESVALLPVLLVLGLALACALAAGRAHELASQAAGAGAMALIQGADPARAARESVPALRERELRVRVEGTRVRVSITPRLPLPGLSSRLSAHASADAGELPRP